MTAVSLFAMLASTPQHPRLTFCLVACLAVIVAAGVMFAMQVGELASWLRGDAPYGDATFGPREAMRLVSLALLLPGAWVVWKTFWAPAEVLIHRVSLAASLTVLTVAGVITKIYVVQWAGWTGLGARLAAAAMVVIVLSGSGLLYRVFAGKSR